MSTIDYAPELGKRFVTILEEWLTPEEFEEVRTRNDARRPNTCASHDFCDANMAMDEAFKDVLQRDPVLSNLVSEAEVEADPDLSDAQVDAIYARTRAGEALDNALIGRAWDWAIEHYLSHSPAALALEADSFPEVARALIEDAEWVDVNNIDPALQVSCDHCGHDKLDHAFFPAADGVIGAPAPLCVGYGRDSDHVCDCEGFISPEQGIANEIDTARV